jgi:tRNA pseudouridine13 synthase
VFSSWQLMYLHAFQSGCWNKAASHRMRTYGLRCVPGDLVLTGNSVQDERYVTSQGLCADGSSRRWREMVLGLDVSGRRCRAREDGRGRMRPEVRVLTEEDISKGQVTIFDVVLPLPGTASWPTLRDSRPMAI